MILCGDIGGTKSLLGLGEGGELRLHRRYANADFPDFYAVIATFLAESGTPQGGIAAACLALAGPIADDGRSAQLTNLPWRVDAGALAARFALPEPHLVNDFAAAALGAVTATAEALVTLQPGVPVPSAPRLVVGAGTGLGMAIVLPASGGWRIVPGEGGHVGFAPADAEQSRLREFLATRHGRVTWERVVSGPGLAAIAEFLGSPLRDPAGISAAADAGGAIERQALSLFLSAYGAYAGDMALACMARGGVYLAGGIAAQLAPRLAAGDFLSAFDAKAEHAQLAVAMPIHVATDPLLGLRGALALGTG